MRCFVTGAAGFVGGHLVTRLKADGHEVKVLVQDDTVAAGLMAEGVEVMIGVPEAMDVEFASQLEGSEVVFHCDAYLDPRGSTEAFRQVNVHGTKRLIEVAAAAGVRRLVYLSSQAVVWNGHDLHDMDEDAPYPSEHVDPYSASRAEAERLVLVAARAGRIDSVAIRPGWTWGPGDSILLPLLVARALRGPIPLVGHGEYEIATTYVQHLVDALVSAAGQGSRVCGKAYFVSDDMALTQRAFIDLQLGAVGVVPQYRHIPSMVARAAAAVFEAAAPWVGAPSPLIRLVTGMAACEITHNTGRARQDLGYAPRFSLDEGLAKLKTWAHGQGGAEALAAMVNLETSPEEAAGGEEP